MSAHGQTMVWGMHLGKSIQDIRGHWLQRIGQWLAGRSESHKAALGMTFHRVWDSQREQFRPAPAESALAQVAAPGGQSWFIPMHSAAL
jgi:hypothetical protein